MRDGCSQPTLNFQEEIILRQFNSMAAWARGHSQRTERKQKSVAKNNFQGQDPKAWMRVEGQPPTAFYFLRTKQAVGDCEEPHQSGGGSKGSI